MSEPERPTQANPEPPEHLRGWKDIASVVHASTRSAQRWERTMGLPVHRVQGLRGMQVFASREELIQWMASDLGRRAREAALTDGDAAPVEAEAQNPEVARRPWRWVVLAASLVAISFVVWGVRTELIPRAAGGPPANQVQPGPQKYPAPLVLLKVSIGSQPPQVIGALSGGLAQVGLPRKQGTLGLRPRLDAGGVAIQLFQVGDTPPNGEPVLTELARGTLAAGFPVRFNLDPIPVTVEWIDKR